MSNPGDIDDTPLTSIRQMADYLAAGCKPAGQFRIGTEHEKFGFRRSDLTRRHIFRPTANPAASATCSRASRRLAAHRSGTRTT